MRAISKLSVIFLILVFCCTYTAFAVEPHGGMMRYPDVSSTHIAFVYADDIWIVPRAGGTASPLASPPGGEGFPRFSPDGRTIAFNGNYDGNYDIYTVAIEGGIPQRVTYHSSGERLCDWSFDNQLVFAMNGLGGLGRQSQLFTVPKSGGMPDRLPVPYGGYGTISGDGQWLAYTPRNRDFRTWKRYRGGWASDIWLFHLTEHTSKKITDWEGTDTIPMWHGKKIYYLSDAGASHRLNIWSYNLESKEGRQITHFKDYDVKWPSNGPGANGEGEIVFEYDARLYLLNLASEQAMPVNISVPGDRPRLRPIRKDVSGGVTDWFISPQAKRVLVQSRGDVWSLPAKNGTPRNLTRTSGIAEREPSWSPDGKWITYFSDESDENELVIRSADGQGKPETITSMGAGFRYQPTWSPDSKWMIFTDNESKFYVFNVEEREVRYFDRVNISGWRMGGPRAFNWSADSQWITYTRPNKDNMNVVMLYNVTEDELHEVTNGMFVDYLPTFDRKGDFLYFFSEREISRPKYADGGLTFIYDDTAVLHAIPLRTDVSNPFKAKSDEEEADKDEKGEKEDEDKKDEDKDKKDKEADGDKESECKDPNDADDEESGESAESEDKDEEKKVDKKDKDKEKDKIKPVEIELENMEERSYRLPIKRGRFGYLEVNDKNHLIYLRRGEESTLQYFDPEDEKREEKTVIEKVSFVQMTPDGKKLLVRSSGKMGIIEAKAGQKLENPVVISPMNVVIEPRQEWRQVFVDAWRFMRDYFYDPHMHKVDWPAVRRQYEAMLDDCVSRRDVGYVIAEMISEVNAGHTYYGGGDVDSGPRQSIGYLGVDFELYQGYYRIAKVYEGGTWDTDARSALSELDKKEREQCNYLFKVNGVPVDTSKAPWAAFEGLAGATVTLTVGAEPDPDKATNVVLKLLGSENDLRYRHWIEANRRHVEKESGGKVGYIHVPDTGNRGQRELFRQFYGQMNKDALIIDERWNGGGNIADRFIELLNRPIYLHLFERYENDWRVPTLSHQGPKCMMINGESGSGGDIFPYLFRKAGLGKLIGMRTWGGVIGISRNPSLIDGARLTVPFITFYETDGTLTMEGHGVDPDIEVIDDPALMADGSDPQLDAAIEHMLDEIEKNPYVPAKRPPYPDRSGMGILEEQK
ncbi:MAG: PD40 domain-containing protein [Planctomycetes bacterium]|nr:PD40 domain-containing protein [Planctomycetota bacterium]